jgi:hypothetical protein
MNSFVIDDQSNSIFKKAADLTRINSYYYSIFIYVCLCRLFMHKYAYATYFVSLSLLDAKYRFIFAVICNGHVDDPHSQ